MVKANVPQNKFISEKINLPDELCKEILDYLSLNDIAKLASTSKLMHEYCKPILCLKAVVSANQEALAALVQANPEALFLKGDVVDLAGQTFYNVSPYQLMIFLADAQLLQFIMDLVRPKMSTEMKKALCSQYEEIDSGGADLVKIVRESGSLSLDMLGPQELSYRLKGKAFNVTVPGLENPDGMVCFINKSTNKKQLYYVTSEKMVEIKPQNHSDQQQIFLALDDVFAHMEDNSSQRSSNNIHQLLATTLRHPKTNQPIILQRKGITYQTTDGVRYCDYRYDFNRYYATSRQCIRLQNEYKAVAIDYFRDDADDLDAAAAQDVNQCWLELGKRQKEVMWLLQILCQKDMPFYSSSMMNKSIMNRRDFIIKDCSHTLKENVYTANEIARNLGSRFTLYKGGSSTAGAWEKVPQGIGDDMLIDFSALCLFITEGRDRVAKFGAEQNIQQRALDSKAFNNDSVVLAPMKQDFSFLFNTLIAFAAASAAVMVVGILILASVIVVPVAPVVIGTALTIIGLASTGFFVQKAINATHPTLEVEARSVLEV